MTFTENAIRVLLADDHAVVRAGIRQFLEHAAGIQVVAEADDGAQAKALIAETEPDVAVLDIQMPQLTGIQVTRWLREQHPRVGVLILTAYDDDPYVMAVLEAGAHGYVLKTAASAEIIQAVREVHEGKSVLDPAITRQLMDHIAGRRGPDMTAATQYEALTERELEVLELAGHGYTNKAIGLQLGISDRTVQGHLAKIYGKLDASSRTEAVMRAVSLGLLAPDLDS
ncbi:MAG: response regulator transcription factor [Anaerolineae bacterium]|nr:response regulator transcription factor [Anaerolineae bacterium]